MSAYFHHILAPMEAPFSGIISAHSPRWLFQKEGNLIMLPSEIHHINHVLSQHCMYALQSNQSDITLQQVQ